MRAHHFISTVAAALLFAASVQAQSLADLAKKEEERRKSVPDSGKVYTNKDLNAAPAPSTPPASSSAAPADAAKSGAKDTDAKDGKDKDAKDKDAKDKDAKDKDASGKELVKDKAYWSSRLKALQDQVEQSQTYADAIQTRINALTTDFVNRDDPAQRSTIERDRQKAIAELARLKQVIVDGKKAIATLEEDARRAGVPPGWLR
jgi:chromosome segregation ATPase